MKDMLQAHGIPVPKLEHVRGALRMSEGSC